MNKDLLYQIAITQIPLVGSVNAKNLISHCGGVEAVFHAKKKELLAVPGIGQHIADNILNQDVLSIAEKELKFIEENNVQTLFYLDKNYPHRLKHYPDCPTLLFYKGNANLNHHRNVAIVGTRKPTERGKLICEQITKDLKKYNVHIISGLAYGIDATAHKTALDQQIPTIGAMGHGLSMIYPATHRNMAQQMTQQGGLLTEYLSHQGPEREHFPMRNRIIAGLCDALIVVETAEKGGSIISAHIANHYNKDVFAVPGRLQDKSSVGCNRLIKTHKAALIESAEDIAYIMRWDAIDQAKIIQPQLFVDLSGEEKTIIDILRDQEQISIDKLSFSTQIPASKMAGLLIGLEFKGMVKMLPGKQYILV